MSEPPLPSLSSLSLVSLLEEVSPLIEETDPVILITLRGLIAEFYLCQVSKLINVELLCNNKQHWRSLLQYAEIHTNVKEARGINPLSSVLDVDKRVIDMEDHEAATMYKAEFRKYVVYRSIRGYTAYKPVESFRNDTWLNLIEFEAQVEKFLGRTNGSTKNVIGEIKRSTKDLRKKDKDYPRIPATFFVTATLIVAKLNMNDPWCQTGQPRISLLIEAIMESPSY